MASFQDRFGRDVRNDIFDNQAGLKYELITHETMRGFFRVLAIKDFECVIDGRVEKIRAGRLGGIVVGPHNLSQDGTCWCDYNTQLTGRARLIGDGQMRDTAAACDDVVIEGVMRDNSFAANHAHVFPTGVMCGDSTAFGHAKIYGVVRDKAHIDGHAMVPSDGVAAGEAVFAFGRATQNSNSGSYLIQHDNVVGVNEAQAALNAIGIATPRTP